MPDIYLNNGPKSFIKIYSVERVRPDDFIEICFNGDDIDLVLGSDALNFDYSFDPGDELQPFYLKLRDVFYWLSKCDWFA
jgi:hypothetical protein